MTSYRFNLKRCPSCNCEFSHCDIASSNTFGATFYTDGFVNGPMHEEHGALLQCPGCHTYLWKEDVPTRESVRHSPHWFDAEKRPLPVAWAMSDSGYLDIFHQALWKTLAQEKYIRIKAWWISNHACRSCSADETVSSSKDEEFLEPAEVEENLTKLLSLLDIDDQHDLIMRAEILRELGRFEECLNLLKQPFDDKYCRTIDVIKKLADCNNRQVESVG